ncbi:hypothetical protein [Nocardia tengchongensis]|uniref:hypothetical protein n=1 Tax=Nocardia tengchongensis TaxID=2055889 RepID=UPI003617E0E7
MSQHDPDVIDLLVSQHGELESLLHQVQPAAGGPRETEFEELVRTTPSTRPATVWAGDFGFRDALRGSPDHQ